MAKTKRQQARDIKLAFAKALIISKPHLGKDAINKVVRAEYGTGLRRIDVARLKESTLIGRPKKSTGMKSMQQLVKLQLVPTTIEAKQLKVATVGFDTAFHMLRSAGFLEHEIRKIFSAHGVSLVFNSKPFKAMVKSRRNLIKEKRKAGWTNSEIVKYINDFYKVRGPDGKPLADPFDFLRKEYQPAPKRSKKDVKQALDIRYERNKQRKAAVKVERLYGRGHRRPVIVR